MRRFFILSTLLIASTVALLVACEETPNVEVPKPELKLLSNPVLLFEEQGGEGEIRYSLKNATEDVALTAVANVEWVSDIVVAETIKFVVAANDVEEVRSAQIAVSYDTLEFVVDIRQAAKKPEPEQPEDPETPEQPEDPETPEQPEDPETPEQPEDPETPEQPEEPEQPKPVLTILSNSILNFGADGTLYEVKYKVENPVEGASVKAVADVEWVTNIVVVDATETITFEVLANDTTKARSAKLWVHYSTILREIEIRQEAGQPAPEPEPEPEPDPTPDPEPEPEPTPDPEPLPDGYDVAYRAACLSGGYIGQEGSAYNYFVILSDVKCSHQRDIEQPNSRFYCLDVYAKSKSDKLPNGTYKIDVNDTFKQGTVAATYSPCVQTDGNGEFIGGMMAYEAGTLTVTDNKIVGEFEMSNGKKHYVIYEGSLMLSYE